MKTVVVQGVTYALLPVGFLEALSGKILKEGSKSDVQKLKELTAVGLERNYKYLQRQYLEEGDELIILPSELDFLKSSYNKANSII